MRSENYSRTNQVLSVFVLLGVGALFMWTIGRTSGLLGAPATGDLKRFWAAGGVLASYQNPYDLKLISNYALTHGAGPTQTLPLYYPPMAFSVLLPLSLLPFELMRLGFLACVGGLALAFWIVPACRHLLRTSGTCERWRALCAFSSYLLFLPVFLMWWVGALTAIPLCALLLFFLFNRCPDKVMSRTAAGACIAFTLVKPTICLLIPPYLLTVWVRRRDWSSMVGFAAGASILLAPALYLRQQFDLSSARDIWDGVLLWRTAAPMQHLLEYLHVRGELRFLPALCGISLVVWHAIRHSRSDDLVRTLCLLLLPLGFVLTPFTWTYDFAPLIFTLAYIFDGDPLASFRVSSHVPSPRAAGAVITMALLLWCSPLAMELHAWYPIGILSAALLELFALQRGTTNVLRRANSKVIQSR